MALHQLSLTSMLLSYLKKNTLSSWMLSQQVSADSDLKSTFNLTTTGLNDVFVQKADPKNFPRFKNKKTNITTIKQTQPNNTGFVYTFGADKPVDVKYAVDGIHNTRVNNGNGTLMLNADLSIEFWANNGTQNEAIDLTVKNCIFYFEIQKVEDSN